MTYLGKIKVYLTRPVFQLNRIQFNLIALFFLSVGLIIGSYLTATKLILPNIFAAESPWQETDWSTATDYSSKTDIDNSTEGQFSLDGEDVWYDSGWSYRKKIVIDAGQVSGTENLTNFPILINTTDSDWADTVNGGHVSQSNGGDILFTAGDGVTKLDHEIESYTNTSGEVVAWVRIPSLDYENNTDVYIYYGNHTGGLDESNASGVWDENYVGVWHLAEEAADTGTSNVYKDSTNYGNHGDDYASATGQSGQIGNGQEFDGNNDYVDLGSPSELNITGNITLSSWVNPSSANNDTVITWANDYSSFSFHHTIETGYIRFNGNNAGNKTSNSGVTLNEWNYVVVTVDGATLNFYVDGQPDSSNPQTLSTDSRTSGDGYITLSRNGSQLLDAFLDEVRVSTVPREESWIKTEYNNQNDPGSFYSVEAEMERYSATGILTSTIYDSGHPSDWGELTYTTSGSGTVTVKVRSDSDENMSGVDGWGSCSGISSGTDLTGTSCVTDEDRYIQYQVTLEPDGAETPVFEEISIAFEASDQDPPGTQASAIKMYTESGGTEISDADDDSFSWTNNDQPYFSWTAGEDAVDGTNLYYCVYLGTSSSEDPRSSKGLLGTSQESTTGTECNGFIASSNSLDLSISSNRGSTWLDDSGSYYLVVTAMDTSGNVKGSPFASFHFQFDDTPPTNPSGLSGPQTYQSDIESITIYWSTSGTSGPTDNESGIAGYQYRIGSEGTWYGTSHTGDEDINDIIDAGTGYYTLNSDYDELEEGENTFYLRTWDSAGNVTDTSVSVIIKYSGSAPTEPQSLEVTPEENEENAFSFSWSAPATYDGQESGIEYCYTINSVPSATSCSWTSETSLTADAYATQPSTNTFYVVAKDEAGNINYDAYANVDFDCNTSAPGVPRNIDVSDISIKATSNWKLAISWDTPEATGAGVTSYRVFRSITEEADCSTNFNEFEEIGTTGGTSYSDTGLSQVDYYYCLKACDSANNCSAISTTDSGYPDGKYTTAVNLTAGPTVSGVTTKKATINWSTDRTSDSKVQYGASSGEYNDEEISSSTHTTDHTIKLTNLSAGETYYYRVKWTDEDGNTGMSEEKSFTTDPAPTVKEVEVTNIGLTTALINFTVTGASKVKIYYGETTSYGGLSEVTTSTTESSYSVQLSGLADGTKYYFKINAFDTEEEEYENQINDFETLPRPRISQVRLEEITGTAQPAVLVTWQTNTAISSIITYYPAGKPGEAKDKVNIELKEGRHRMLLKDLIADENYILIVKGRDKAGNEAESGQQTFTTATDTRPPVISNLKVEGTVEGTGEEAKAQLLVSFNTDEGATSQVEFGEGTGTTYSQKTQEDSELTNNHLVIVPNLTPSKVYHLRAIAKDKAGNESRSVDTVTITPKATENALNLVITNLSEVFGFLTR
jgi:hypothetical protein